MRENDTKITFLGFLSFTGGGMLELQPKRKIKPHRKASCYYTQTTEVDLVKPRLRRLLLHYTT